MLQLTLNRRGSLTLTLFRASCWSVPASLTDTSLSYCPTLPSERYLICGRGAHSGRRRECCIRHQTCEQSWLYVKSVHVQPGAL